MRGTMRTFALPLSLDLLQWLEGWTPPYCESDAPPLAIPEKIVLAVILAKIHDAREPLPEDEA